MVVYLINELTVDQLERVPEGVADPLEHVTAEHREKMNHLRQTSNTWNLAPAEQEFVDDMCLYRFLTGLHWDEKIATAQLKEACDWRAQYKPQELRLKDVEKAAKLGYAYSVGIDKKQHPVIYLQLGKDTLANDEEGRDLKLKFVVYIMEQVIRIMPKGVYSMTWVIDVEGASLTMSVIKQMKDMFAKIGDYYTERLRMAFLCNTPWSISLLWNFVKMFLAKETVAKYQFVSGKHDKLMQQFAPFIDAEQLIDDFGGKAKVHYNYEKMLEFEEKIVRIDRERLDRKKAAASAAAGAGSN